ncbi:hypothetical protein Bca101_093322 [Brassica carinata]
MQLLLMKRGGLTEGVPDGHYPATWKLDVTTFSRKSKMSFDFAQTFDNLRSHLISFSAFFSPDSVFSLHSNLSFSYLISLFSLISLNASLISPISLNVSLILPPPCILLVSPPPFSPLSHHHHGRRGGAKVHGGWRKQGSWLLEEGQGYGGGGMSYVYLHSFMILLVKKVQFHRFQKPATLQASYFGAIDHQLLKPFKFTSQLSRSQACRPRRKITLGGSTTPPWTVSRQNTHGKSFANVVPCNFEHPTYGSKELPKTCIPNSINQSYSTFSESIMLPGNRSRNQSSGAKNNKKARQDEVIKSQANDLLKYVTRKSSKADEICKTEEDKEDEEVLKMLMRRNENIESQEKADDIKSFHEDVDMDDLGNWKKIEQRMRDYLVERGLPTRPSVDYPFPRDGFRTWNALSDWKSFSDSSSSLKLLKRLVCQAAAYCVRSERNKLLHYNISTPPGTISKLLDRFIRDDVLSKRNKQSSGLMQHWLVND